MKEDNLEVYLYWAQQLELQLQKNIQVIVPLIELYKVILRQLQPDENPSLYAHIQANLGTAYSILPTGDRLVNLMQALQCYQEALRCTSEISPLAYAMIQNNLGSIYLELPAGDRTANLEQAIKYYQEALRFRTPETAPLDYAITQTVLGNAYRELSTGDRLAHLKQAIICYQEALRFLTPGTTPLDYALIQDNLGSIYLELPTGDRTANLEQAIKYYQEALRFRTPEPPPLEQITLRFGASYMADYATTQNNLGNAYRELLTGDRTANLEQAIKCYQEALRFRTSETAPLGYAATQNSLGVAYLKLLAGDRAANLEQAIRCFHEVLRFCTPETAPLDYAMAQDNLGIAYCVLSTGNRTTNLEQAITYFQEALRFRTPETAPLDYANTQNNLGNVYRELPTGNRAANLEQAIKYYREALRFRTSEATPLLYATTQNNLGNVYRELPTGDRAANIEQAIKCYQEALRFHTPKTAPSDYAMTQSNLGGAYYMLPTGNRAANLEQAIKCFEEALRFRTPETAPLDYAIVQDKLGTAYTALPTGDRTAHVEQAIKCFGEALRFYTPEVAPLSYAMTQNNLAYAYHVLPIGDHAANVEQAIKCLEEALRFYTPEVAPLDYATVQNNLGNSYYDLSTGDRATNLERAIQCFKEALRFCTPETAPFECRKTNHALANLYFSQGKWQAAFDTYRVAIDVGELLYRADMSTGSKAIEASADAALYHHAAFCAVRCGEPTKAFLILEQGKTRLLTEALRLRIRRPAHIPDQVWSAFEDAATAVRVVQAGSQLVEESDLVLAYEMRENEARHATTNLNLSIEHVRVYAPEFLQQIDLPTIQAQLLNEHRALIAFCFTEQGCIGFIVSHHQDVQVVEVPSITSRVLRQLCIEPDRDDISASGWLGAYLDSLSKKTTAVLSAWQSAISRTLMTLGHSLLVPIISMISSDIAQLVLLPSAELFLFPLHAAPLSDSTDTDLLCDRYQVSYAPSIEVLFNCQTKAEQEVARYLYAVINPQADPQLIFTSYEGARVNKLFTQSDIDEGQIGTKQRVISNVYERTYLHFACHGSYVWNDPPSSGLDLADSRLALADLQRGEIDISTARIVVLSACESGITDVFLGSADEYVGIPAGFLLAGVPCVVSSLWAVYDFSTALLMERFYYCHLQSKMDFAAAMREAQRWMRTLSIEEVAQYAEQYYRQSGQEISAQAYYYMRYYRSLAKHNPGLCPFAHPHYWAAFTVNGL